MENIKLEFTRDELLKIVNNLEDLIRDRNVSVELVKFIEKLNDEVIII